MATAQAGTAASTGDEQTNELRRPLIGVPGMWSGSVQGLRFDGIAVAVEVLRSILRAGGEPVILFPSEDQGDRSRYAVLDGVVLPGGADVSPELYGEVPADTTQVAHYGGQDAAEIAVLRDCIDMGIPTLAICRGLQLLNVACEGTLTQHLDADVIDHVNSLHTVDITEGSRTAAAIRTLTPKVSSYHHQGVAKLGRGLRIVGRADDGVIEAIEHDSAPIVAVQWHPEDNAATLPSDQALFDWVVQEARSRKLGKTEPSAAQEKVDIHP
ncbi:gamma-glutamyl-gamma-aminobutyrate hydrolase family protein [Arthrobacter bambusae]|uniref:gamma-glutamyl-gamma-aminobutyrate hydrolase family protein n=1 Tax=Arthrobacter bambusae TaxID=1338426 RepID=UPI002788B006|nr:gamma-glutamyl-gamma-aminobutyrate hydrolase family protein [Arthrobacter bambusae]MDQ0029915.1 putative glutamine amidotransferase [Arthrobacter bambusae]MDQ0097567.1 putative glutamine amidotransferase [Arthrobacter bambusae]